MLLRVRRNARRFGHVEVVVVGQDDVIALGRSAGQTVEGMFRESSPYIGVDMFTALRLHYFGLYYCLILLAPARGAGVATNGVEIEGVEEAAVRAVGLVDRASSAFLTKRNCFACHSQTLSVLVLKKAMQVGITVDRNNLKSQRDRAFEALNATRIDTFGYALWALDAAEQTPDTNTAALVALILRDGDPAGPWQPTIHRPPAEASKFTSTFLALRGARRYGTELQYERIRQRREAVRKWLDTDPPALETEDQVFRLRLAHELQLPEATLQAHASKLLAAQTPAGGWAQRPGLPPDAYATGTALTALHEAGGLSVTNHVWRQAIRFLVQTQSGDGSWQVVTGVKPIQEYFESGFPHGTNQFISAFATGWATLALLTTLDEQK